MCYEPTDNFSTVDIAQLRNCSRRTLLSVLQSRVGNVQCSVCTGACGLQASTSVTSLLPPALVQLWQLVARVGVLAIYVDKKA